MVSRTPSEVVGARALVSGALSTGSSPDKAPDFLDELRDIARQEAGLALRLGMVLACIKQFDLATVGCSGFLSFCKEHVDWGSSWARAIVRLVESPLDHVKAAVAAGELPLRVAVQAPGKVAIDEQEAWLGGEREQAPPPSRPRVLLRDDDAEILTRARDIARSCLGHDAPTPVLDAFISRHQREHVPGKALEEGRTPPPAPEPRELDFGWADSAPAEALLGPWRPPADLAHALEQLEAVQMARRGRLSELARGFARVHAETHWTVAGYDSAWAYAEQALGWSRRTAQRHLELGRALQRFPQLDHAVREGLAPEAARSIARFAESPHQCDRLLELAWHLGPRDLKQALANDGERLGDYERALDLARHHEDALLGPDGPTTRPSGVTDVFRIAEEAVSSAGSGAPAGLPGEPGEAAASCPGDGASAERLGSPGQADASSAGTNGSAELSVSCGEEAASSVGTGGSAELSVSCGEGAASSAGTGVSAELPGAHGEADASSAGTPARRRCVRLRISLMLPEPERQGVVYAHPELLEAARWFVENNPLPQLSGFAARKAHVGYRCENPECWRRSLLNQTHHIQWQQHGGSDDPDNAVGLCRRCHHGGVHTRDERIRVTRVELEGLRTRLWEYTNRAPILQFLDLPPRPEAVA